MTTTSAKSKAELEQVALAMMMMAGGEGTSSVRVTEKERVGMRVTRSSSSRSSLNNRRNQQEPVSRNGSSKNNRKSHDRPRSPEENEGEEEHSDALEQSHSIADLMQQEPEDAIICAVNPMSFQSSPSPTGSPRSTNSGSGSAGGGGQPNNDDSAIYSSSSRRVFRPEFKQKVLDAFANDPECVGNQRATARKFGIHRRQVQKWLQQVSTGELSFNKDLQREIPESQQDAENPVTGFINDLIITTTSTKRVRASLGNHSSGVAKSGRVIRRSTGNIGNNRPLHLRNRATADLTTRPTRSSTRNKGKSMPLKGGSKPASHHFVPKVVHPSPGSTSLLNLSKGSSKQNGGGSSYAYYNDSNRNGIGGNSGSGSTATNGGTNMFMNMTSLLASAAAAGNLAATMPNFSPTDHCPVNGRGSPAHSAGGSSGGSNNSSLQNALLLVDELNYLYPYSDFSLLRKALLKEEVSLEKLAHPLLRHKSEFRVNGNNGINSDFSQGRRDLRRVGALSPSPTKSTSSQHEYNTQQTLDIIRQQQEYLKLLQQCGIGNSSDISSGLNLSDNGRIPAWFNPFAAAAAAGLPIPSSSGTSSGGGKFNGVNGSGTEIGRRNKDSNDNHRFASPRVPPAVNSGKAKTVAAALAATRVQSSPQHLTGRNYTTNRANGRQSQGQRSAQRRKPNASATRSVPQIDDDIDPTSMLEVVTSIPSPSISPRTTVTNQYNYNAQHHQRSSSNGNGGSNDFHQGMDLTTTSAPAATATTTSTTTRLISKAMSKEYSFLNELGLVRKSPDNIPTTSSGTNGYGITHTASLENFVQNILPTRQKSPQAASSSTSSSSPPATDLNDSEKTKNLVIDTFTYDPEIAGDARAVARKFGLNARVVMKWLKEGPVKSSPQSNEDCHENGVGSGDNYNFSFKHKPRMNGDCFDTEYHQAHSLHKAMMNESNNNSHSGTSVNKRKNSKPNQICDFATEDDDGLNGALDMVVPIKKRRVSSPSPTPQDT